MTREGRSMTMPTLRHPALSAPCFRRLSTATHYFDPLLTRPIADALLSARDAGAREWIGSLDLGLSDDNALLETDAWQWRGQRHSYPPASSVPHALCARRSRPITVG